MKKAIKITAITLASVVGAMILTVLIYVLYVFIQYSRIEDNLALEVRANTEQSVDGTGTYSIMTYNVGFGAYSPEYSFFMDTGAMEDGTPTKGKYGKGISREDVQKNTDGSADVIRAADCDFAFIQEVDRDSSRSYRIDQHEAIASIEGYASVYALNYHSAYLFYPFNDPHGKNTAGIVTLSKYKIASSTRRSFPISSGFSKFTDLDRCFSVTRYDVGDKQLVLINQHMSAYDKGGTIRAEQLAMLNDVLKAEREAGNWVIAGGDFNHDIAGEAGRLPSKQQTPEWLAVFDTADLTDGYTVVAATNAPTCRGADIPYEEGVSFTVVIDGFIVSDNVEVKSIENMDLQFRYSDHNPAVMRFKLK